jgi:hypothetical protein
VSVSVFVVAVVVLLSWGLGGMDEKEY